MVQELRSAAEPKGSGAAARIDPRVYSFALAGPVVLAGALAVQLLLVALLVAPQRPRPAEDLSEWGKYLFYPEWDIAFYLLSIVLAVALGLAFVRRFNTRLAGSAGTPTDSLLLRQSVAQVVVAIAATAVHVRQFVVVQALAFPPTEVKVTAGEYAVFAVAAAVCLAAALGARVAGGPKTDGLLAGFVKSAHPKKRRPRISPWDALVPAAVIALIYVPEYRDVAGRVLLDENLFHWDYFAMGPALAFNNGLALGSQVHSAYGVGWPMLFSALEPWVPISYGSMIHVGSIYAVIYLIGVYAFLRMATRHPIVAVLGVAGVMAPFFFATYGLRIWRVPNVTILRWPMDIWCFIALAAYTRTSKRSWAIGAGIAVGLALVFLIDTGAELGLAAALFWLGTLALPGDRKRRFGDLLASGGSAVAVLGIGLLLAGRGDVLNSEFLHGWLEAPLEFGGGFGMLPIVTSARPATLIGFVAVAITMMSVVIYSLAKLMVRDARPRDIMTGFLAVYALLVMVKWAGHSADLIFPRLIGPSVIVAALLLDRALSRTGAYLRSRSGAGARAALLSPYALIAAVLAGLIWLPGSVFTERPLQYPSLAARALGPQPEKAETLCLMTEPRDLCGLPPHLLPLTETFQQVVDRLEGIVEQGDTYATVEETGSLFYVATGSAPFGRYSRMFTATHTRELVDNVRESFEQNPPDYILTRLGLEAGTLEFNLWAPFGYGPGPYNFYGDTWEALLEVVSDNYVLEEEIRPFQIYRRTEDAGAE